MNLPAAPEDKKSFRILVVEDDASIAKLILVNLKKSGFDARFASDGIMGMNAFRELDPHLVLTDISMPGMSGHELVAKIREESIVPIIMMTAMDSPEWQMQAFKGGADDYVPKPFNIQLLMARVIANLRRVYRYTPPAAAAPAVFEKAEELAAKEKWPMCSACSFSGPQNMFDSVDPKKGRVFSCPICHSRQIVFPLA
jgi:DNA-binding response OmpR family regulator